MTRARETPESGDPGALVTNGIKSHADGSARPGARASDSEWVGATHLVVNRATDARHLRFAASQARDRGDDYEAGVFERAADALDELDDFYAVRRHLYVPAPVIIPRGVAS